MNKYEELGHIVIDKSIAFNNGNIKEFQNLSEQEYKLYKELVKEQKEQNEQVTRNSKHD